MPLVNLISEQRAQLRAALQRTRLFMLAWVVSIAIAVSAVGGLLWQTDRQNSRLADLKSKSSSMAPYQRAIAEGQAELAQLRPKLVTLQSASRSTEAWLRMLRHVGARIPEGVWLTAIRTQESKGKEGALEVRFTGYARDQALVGVTMQRLNEFPGFKRTDLKYTAEKEQGNNVGVEFEIVSQIDQTGGRDRQGGEDVGS